MKFSPTSALQRKNSGFQFRWTSEEAIMDWFEDNEKKYLE